MKNEKQLFIYEKIGDIAHQIYRLQLKDRPLPTIGNIVFEDPQQLIDIHWKRIAHLKVFLELPNSRVKDILENFRDLVCDKCKDTLVPCEKDYENVCIMKLAEEVIKYED